MGVRKKLDLAEADDDALDFLLARVGFGTIHFEDRVTRRDRVA